MRFTRFHRVHHLICACDYKVGMVHGNQVRRELTRKVVRVLAIPPAHPIIQMITNVYKFVIIILRRYSKQLPECCESLRTHCSFMHLHASRQG